MFDVIKRQVKSEQKDMPVTTVQRVLLLSPFFFPELISTGRYNTWLARALVKRSVKVTVVTSFPLYPVWKPILIKDSVSGIDTHRSGLYVWYPKSAIGRRLVLEIWFGVYALFWSVKLRNKIDTVVTITPPGLFLPYIRKVLPKHVSLIGVVHDLQGVMAKATHGWTRKIIARMVSKLERRALSTCDKLICLSKSMKQVVTESYWIDKRKCNVHYPFPTLADKERSRSDLEAYFPEGFHHVVYAGALGEKQRPRELLEFFKQLCQRRKDIMCHVFSAGPYFKLIQKEMQVLRTDRLFLRGLVPEEELAELYERSTVQVIPQAGGTAAGAFPSKLPNLFATGVPVFAIYVMRTVKLLMPCAKPKPESL